MALCTYEHKVHSIKQLIKGQIHHPYLLNHIQSPEIDDDLILMLLAAARDAGEDDERMMIQVAAAMMVQIALDTHDDVTNGKGTQQERQLTVLAGDYFSGLYFKLLAEIQEVDLIRVLASSIKKINEEKIKAYHFDHPDLDDFMNSLKQIETTVIDSFSGYFGASAVQPLFSEYLFIRRLLSELDKFNSGSFSFLFEGIKALSRREVSASSMNNLSLHVRNDMIDICSSYINASRESLLAAAEKAPAVPPVIQTRINKLAESLDHMAT